MAEMPANQFQTVVTSPPYFGLRDYRVDGQIGREPTPNDFIKALMEVFNEVHRVMRDDATLWVNIGDCYNSGTTMKRRVDPNSSVDVTGWNNDEKTGGARIKFPGLKPKNLCGFPWRLAFAMQNAGWFLRSDVIWYKRNKMPESASDRPTMNHEYVFLFTKSERYFYDGEAVRENVTVDVNDETIDEIELAKGAGRNARTVWDIPTTRSGGDHFASFPIGLAERCILAGTPEHGCCAECHAPYVRELESVRVRTRPGKESKSYDRITGEVTDDGIEKPWRSRDEIGNRDPGRHVTFKRTLGWTKPCDCQTTNIVPARVLDPFSGTGTTVAAALQAGRDGVGIELNPGYASDSEKRIAKALRPQSFRDESIVGDAPLFTGDNGHDRGSEVHA